MTTCQIPRALKAALAPAVVDAGDPTVGGHPRFKAIAGPGVTQGLELAFPS